MACASVLFPHDEKPSMAMLILLELTVLVIGFRKYNASHEYRNLN